VNLLVIFLAMTVGALALDFIWISFVANDFYLRAFADFGRISADGKFEPILWSAGLVYLLIPLAVLVFVVAPSRKENLVATIAKGALLGFCIYGVYDFTNLATLRSWSLLTSVVDITWGTFLCATVSALGKSLIDRRALADHSAHGPAQRANARNNSAS
jgi:uncharacterized membrane protein